MALMCTADLFASQLQAQLAARCFAECRGHTPLLISIGIYARLWLSRLLILLRALMTEVS